MAKSPIRKPRARIAIKPSGQGDHSDQKCKGSRENSENRTSPKSKSPKRAKPGANSPSKSRSCSPKKTGDVRKSANKSSPESPKKARHQAISRKGAVNDPRHCEAGNSRSGKQSSGKTSLKSEKSVASHSRFVLKCTGANPVKSKLNIKLFGNAKSTTGSDSKKKKDVEHSIKPKRKQASTPANGKSSRSNVKSSSKKKDGELKSANKIVASEQVPSNASSLSFQQRNRKGQLQKEKGKRKKGQHEPSFSEMDSCAPVKPQHSSSISTPQVILNRLESAEDLGSRRSRARERKEFSPHSRTRASSEGPHPKGHRHSRKRAHSEGPRKKGPREGKVRRVSFSEDTKDESPNCTDDDEETRFVFF